MFSTVGKGIIEAFVGGFNGTIFAYGQTGSGKTFTMLGPPDDSNEFFHELRGVIPRSFEYAFSLINRQQVMVLPLLLLSLQDNLRMNCSPVCLSNVCGPGLHRKLWSGFLQV